MKNTLIITAILFSFGATAQIETKEEDKDKRIEVIKIIDGDTVLHTVKECTPGEMDNDHRKMVRYKMKDCDMSELDEDIERMMEDMDVFINVDGMHKKMIIRQMSRGDEDFEDVIESLEKNESIVIEFEDGRRKMKVMKIEIDGDDLEEITTIELRPRHGDHKGHGPKKHMMKKGGSSVIKAYPNPTKDQINLEFEVLKGDAELSIRDMDGKVIFNKTYKEAGEYKEKIKLNNKKNEILLIQLKEEGRVETRKIIVD